MLRIYPSAFPSRYVNSAGDSARAVASHCRASLLWHPPVDAGLQDSISKKHYEARELGKELMGFKAINDAGPGFERSSGETEEARESRIIQSYERALLLIAQGRSAESLVRHRPQQAL